MNMVIRPEGNDNPARELLNNEQHAHNRQAVNRPGNKETVAANEVNRLYLTHAKTANTDSGQDDSFLNAVEILAALHRLGVNLRITEKKIRELSRDTEINKLQDAAGKIFSAAGLAFGSSITGGVLQIGSGVTSGVGAVRSSVTASGKGEFTGESRLGKAMASVKNALFKSETSMANRSGTDIPVTERFRAGDMQLAKWNSAGQLLQGQGQTMAGGLNYGSEEQKAEKSRVDAEATSARYNVQNDDELIQRVNDLINDVASKALEILNAQHQTLQRIVTV